MNPLIPRSSHAQRSQITQQHLIATAIQVIQDKGYESASIFEVAKTAGMTPGAVQHHFESKAVLMMNVLTQLIEADDHAGALWPLPGVPLPERASHFVHAIWNLVYAQPRFIAAWNTYLACRSTPQLLAHIAALRQGLNVRLQCGFLVAFPELQGQPDADGFIGMVFSTLRGLGLLEMFKPACEANTAQLQCLVDVIVRRCERGH